MFIKININYLNHNIYLSIMKTFTKYLTFFIVMSLISPAAAFSGSPVAESDSVEMGPSYANDIYYSMKHGQVASVERGNWDIAFHTPLFSATILTNGATGVNLYSYPNADTTGWNSIDTTGLSGWAPLYDHPDDWEIGAFNRHETGHPDYGWGKYNPVSHEVIGDSLYIIQLRDGSFKKLWIVKRGYVNGGADYLYVFKFANLDNSGEITVQLNPANYLSKNFIYYSLQTNEVIDRDPESSTWDLLFTKYMSVQPNGEPYPVTGVLNNFNVAANKNQGVTPDFIDWTALPLDTAKSPIGWDWKVFDMQTFTWSVVDSLVYFVQSLEGDVYKLYFTKFTGSSSGKAVFVKELTSSLAVGEPVEETAHFSVYPNPASGFINLVNENAGGNTVKVILRDITGKSVLDRDVDNSGSVRLDLEGIPEGIYLLTIDNGAQAETHKLIISSR